MVLVDSTFVKDTLYLGMHRARDHHLNQQIFNKMVTDTYYEVFVEEVESYKKQFKFFSGAIDAVTKLSSTTDALNGYLKEREVFWWNWFD